MSKNKKKNNVPDSSLNTGETTETQQTQADNVPTGGSMSIVIEKGIPIPPIKMKAKYRFDLLGEGDSFVIPKKTTAASVTVNYWKKQLRESNPKVDFVLRSVQEKELTELKEKGMIPQDTEFASRVWRQDLVES